MREATDSPPLHNRKDIFRRIKRPKRPALDIATPKWGVPAEERDGNARIWGQETDGKRQGEKSKHDYHIV